MEIPSTLILLGEPIEVLLGTEMDSANAWTFQKNKFYFATDTNGVELWILPKPKTKRITKKVSVKSAQLFRRFSGWHPDKAWLCEVSEFTPKAFGNCLAIAYRSNKWSGRKVSYIHTFESDMAVKVDDKKNPGVWRITGAKLKVEARGITG